MGEASFKNNENEKQFEFYYGGSISKLTYSISEDTVSLNHAEVPSGIEGEGIGSKLIEKTLDYIKENNLKFIPNCVFVKAYVKRHPECQSLLAKENNS
jgi:uncharacterized protein